MRCLDTNIVIAVLNNRSPDVSARFDTLAQLGDLALPAVALFELEFGLAKSTKRQQAEERLATLLEIPLEILLFGAADAREAANIRATLFRAGTPIGPYAQARCRGATLVTANTREFARVPGLVLEDWTTTI